jgi:preprotein translocase subunit SecY
VNTKANNPYQELINRLLFVALGILIFRVGAHIPVPGIDLAELKLLVDKHSTGFLGLFNMFSGGAMSRLTLFTLGVMPYITASIIIQLLSMTFSPLEQLKKEGAKGRSKIAQYTRFAALGFAIMQSIGVSKLLIGQNLVLEPGLSFYIITGITLSTGTLFLMWLGEMMTERGVGNGISIIIFSGIVSRFPDAVVQFFTQAKQGQIHIIAFIGIILAVSAFTFFVVFVERAQRQIPISYPARAQGARISAARSSVFPLKINMAGVIPAILASSLVFFPGMITSIVPQSWMDGGLGDVIYLIGPGQPIYFALFVAAICYFCYFYTSLAFNPSMADNVKRSGAIIPGIRPGKMTRDYIESVMMRLTFIACIYLSLLCTVPEMLYRWWQMPFSFGGTSLLIVVVVVIDFVSQIQAHLIPAQYASLVKKGKKSNMDLLR